MTFFDHTGIVVVKAHLAAVPWVESLGLPETWTIGCLSALDYFSHRPYLEGDPFLGRHYVYKMPSRATVTNAEYDCYLHVARWGTRITGPTKYPVAGTKLITELSEQDLARVQDHPPWRTRYLTP